MYFGGNCNETDFAKCSMRIDSRSNSKQLLQIKVTGSFLENTFELNPF